ncbi:hypothetical protein K469DRAFT_366748 [Zopfia rhizophila CBS 207.26]|uniref:Uncharacterized protein n=1 Tax=Zopfia rhizophila CBS 207.26 TaxID=1314779 RepID=A0A6A6EM99_9PEZI|nr:hypothetical protein K469DRAFT_366748 [Zopfia rhizophila CBS 207.26]
MRSTSPISCLRQTRWQNGHSFVMIGLGTFPNQSLTQLKLSDRHFWVADRRKIELIARFGCAGSTVWPLSLLLLLSSLYFSACCNLEFQYLFTSTVLQ